MWISKRNDVLLYKWFQILSMAATRQGVLFYALESGEGCFIFQAVLLPKGGQRRTNLLLITPFWWWCSIILLFLAGWAPHKAVKARLWWWQWQMVSSLGLCVLILPFQMSAFFFLKYAHDTAPLDECSVTACISTAHSAVWLSLVARNLQYLTLTPSRSSSTLSTPI